MNIYFLLIGVGLTAGLFGGVVGFRMGTEDRMALYLDEQSKRLAVESEALHQKRCRQLLEEILEKVDPHGLRSAATRLVKEQQRLADNAPGYSQRNTAIGGPGA